MSDTTWMASEIDNLQDTVEDLEVELDNATDKRDEYFSALTQSQDRYHTLKRAMDDKIRDANQDLWKKAMIYLDLIKEYDQQLHKLYTIRPGSLTNVRIKHLRKKGDIDV